MAEIVEYTALEGDRWDLIAWRAYGDAALFHRILEANPGAVAGEVLEAGKKIAVPILTEEEQTETAGLPPWKQ